jgi:hypothetical protein
MSSTVHIAGPVAYIQQSSSAVVFSKTNTTAGVFQSNEKGTAAPIKKLQNALNIAYWGEDNRFPQNIEQQFAYYGVGKAALDWKARALYGTGVIPGKVINYEDGGKTEIFQPLDRTKYKVVYDFLEDRRTSRFFLEYLQDWTWFFNCFPEACLSNDGKTITHFVHQESCDSRYVQMNENGIIDKVYLSKLWGAGDDQWAKFDPKKTMRGLFKNPSDPSLLDSKYLKQLDCVDMYNQVDSLKLFAEQQVQNKGLKAFKSAIVPVNYPSPNKTYYQVPYWDGARLGGWVEIACKIPSLLKILYSKGFKLKYHIEIPETFFEQKFGFETWNGMEESKQLSEKKKLLQDMDNFLSGDENAYKTFVSFFQVDNHDKKEYGQIKINAIEDKTNIDKELLTSTAADFQFMAAAQIDPTLMGGGIIGTGQQRSGGSDKREAYLIYGAQLFLERKVMLEPLYVMRDYNREVGAVKEWENDIEFRIRDTVLTTLDKGSGTSKVVS